ncbi:MAG: hypothetical protein ACTSUN_04295 [Promethearchaeota archaeon]
MNLKKIFAEITKKLDDMEEEREKILRLSREMIRNCSIAIKSVHRKENEKYLQEMAKLNSMHEQLIRLVNTHPLYFGKYLKTAEQEFTEALCLYSIINNQEILAPSELKIDEINFSLGLADVIGELRRYILDNMRKGNMENIETLLSKMDEIYTYLFSLDYPKGIIQELRHKTDIARNLIEKTRGEITLALLLHKQPQEVK